MADRDLNHLYPAFSKKVQAAVAEMNRFLSVHYPQYTCKVIEGYRSTARQKELYAQGRTKPGRIVTYKNGTSNESNHQSSLSVDLGIFIAKNGAYVEEPPAQVWNYWGHCVRAQGLEWGGDWKSFKDMPHAEWPTSDKKVYFLARAWQVLQKLRGKA